MTIQQKTQQIVDLADKLMLTKGVDIEDMIFMLNRIWAALEEAEIHFNETLKRLTIN